MKSILVERLIRDPDSADAKAFVNDIKETLALPLVEREACLAELPAIRLARTKSARKRIVDSFIETRELERSEIEHALVLFNFLLGLLLRKDVGEKDAEHWAGDLEEQGLLSSDDRPTFEEIVDTLRSKVVPQIEPEIRRRDTAGGTFPVLAGADFTVEVRPVRDESYRLGLPVESYEPKFNDTAIIASIGISVDVGTPEDFFFQAEESDVDLLLDMLLAAKKEMKALRIFLKLDQGKERHDGSESAES